MLHCHRKGGKHVSLKVLRVLLLSSHLCVLFFLVFPLSLSLFRYEQEKCPRIALGLKVKMSAVALGKRAFGED